MKNVIYFKSFKLFSPNKNRQEEQFISLLYKHRCNLKSSCLVRFGVRSELWSKRRNNYICWSK